MSTAPNVSHLPSSPSEAALDSGVFAVIPPRPGKEEAEISRDELRQRLERLLNGKAKGGRSWELAVGGKGVRRDVRFRTFRETWAFMNTIAEQCKKAKHHPEWTNSFNRTTITWTTHKPEGLTIKDLEMAEYCDEQAKVHGEVEDGEETMSCSGQKGKG